MASTTPQNDPAPLVDIEDLVPPSAGDELNVRTAPSQQVRIKHSLKKLNRKNPMQQDIDQDYLKEVPGQGSVYVKTFGCSHNISDSEFMMGQLSDYGYQLAEQPEQADLVLINSCTVKNPSQDAFLNWVRASRDRDQKVVVAGCVPQGDQNIPELQGLSVVGVKNIDRVVEVVSETFKGHSVQLTQQQTLPSLALPKIRKNNLVEIVPINAGCLGACTYCKTVQARGKLGSYPIKDLLDRIQAVCAEGVKEIWLTSEDTGAWGRDLESNIAVLLRRIVEVLPKQVMLRVGMTNPPYILAHLESVAHVLNHPQVYSFLHIPVQAGSNAVLHQMNREYTVEEFKYCCDQLLARVPDITLATDIICGFPGETDSQWQETMDLCRHYQFRVLNISQFYPRPGTPAFRMKRVNTKTVKSRSRELTQLFESYSNWHCHHNKIILVLATDIEHRKGMSQVVAHSKNYAKVLLPHDESLLGTFLRVKVKAVHKWHLEVDIIQRNVELESVDHAQWFMDYNEVGETSREKKYQEVIKARLQRQANQEIYTTFDLSDNNLPIPQDHTPSQTTTHKNSPYQFIDTMAILGVVMILIGFMLGQFTRE